MRVAVLARLGLCASLALLAFAFASPSLISSSALPSSIQAPALSPSSASPATGRIASAISSFSFFPEAPIAPEYEEVGESYRISQCFGGTYVSPGTYYLDSDIRVSRFSDGACLSFDSRNAGDEIILDCRGHSIVMEEGYRLSPGGERAVLNSGSESEVAFERKIDSGDSKDPSSFKPAISSSASLSSAHSAPALESRKSPFTSFALIAPSSPKTVKASWLGSESPTSIAVLLRGKNLKMKNCNVNGDFDFGLVVGAYGSDAPGVSVESVLIDGSGVKLENAGSGTVAATSVGGNFNGKQLVVGKNTKFENAKGNYEANFADISVSGTISDSVFSHCLHIADQNSNGGEIRSSEFNYCEEGIYDPNDHPIRFEDNSKIRFLKGTALAVKCGTDEIVFWGASIDAKRDYERLSSSCPSEPAMIGNNWGTARESSLLELVEVSPSNRLVKVGSPITFKFRVRDFKGNGNANSGKVQRLEGFPASTSASHSTQGDEYIVITATPKEPGTHSIYLWWDALPVRDMFNWIDSYQHFHAYSDSVKTFSSKKVLFLDDSSSEEWHTKNDRSSEMFSARFPEEWTKGSDSYLMFVSREGIPAGTLLESAEARVFLDGSDLSLAVQRYESAGSDYDRMAYLGSARGYGRQGADFSSLNWMLEGGDSNWLAFKVFGSDFSVKQKKRNTFVDESNSPEAEEDIEGSSYKDNSVLVLSSRQTSCPQVSRLGSAHSDELVPQVLSASCSDLEHYEINLNYAHDATIEFSVKKSGKYAFSLDGVQCQKHSGQTADGCYYYWNSGSSFKLLLRGNGYLGSGGKISAVRAGDA